MNKISVMIVDDEKLTLDDFISMFDWEANGFEIVATSTNGRQALTKYKEFLPQIVISDIKMPLMDGIELIQQIRKLNSQTKLILLTAYSEFSYAKEAIKQGITDYILKSEISRESISEKLLNIKKQIEIEERSRGMVAEKAVLDFFRANDRFYINSTGYDPDVVKFLTAPHFFIIVERDVPLPLDPDIVDSEQNQNEREFISQCMAFSGQDFQVEYAGRMLDEHILLFIKPYEKYSRIAVYSAISRGAAALQDELMKKSGCSFTLFILFNELTLVDLKKIYADKKDLLDVKYILGNKKVYDLQNSDLTNPVKKVTVDGAYVEHMIGSLDAASLNEYIEATYGNISPKNLDCEGLLHISQSLYLILKRETEKLLPTTQKPHINPDTEKRFWMNKNTIMDWMKNQFGILVEARQNETSKKYSPEVIKAIQFISLNYPSRGLKIDLIAAEVGLSANRLSVIFKKETSCTINELITKMRIDKAKELIDGGTHKIYEIAALVGYGSSQYFSQIFWMATGQSPIDYKKRIRK